MIWIEQLSPTMWFYDSEIKTTLGDIKLDNHGTWDCLKDKPEVYSMRLTTKGRSISTFFDAEELESFNQYKAILLFYMKAIQETKLVVDPGKSINDYLPKKILNQFFAEKYRLVQKISTIVEKPKNYDFLWSLCSLVRDISEQKLLLDNRQFVVYPELRKVKKHIYYNIFKSRTGRLTTDKGSFPLLTLRKDKRKAIIPRNDYFLEMDYNAAELRVLLGLSGEEQPEIDLHEWNQTKLFYDDVDVKNRNDSKKKIFSWLYDLAKYNAKADAIYRRNEVKEKYWSSTTQTIQTIFDRTLTCDADHAVNYIVQSTTSDMFLSHVIKLNSLLKGKRTFISFLLHDSVVLDFAKEDLSFFDKLKESFENTWFGKFLVNVSVGSNFGEMRRI